MGDRRLRCSRCPSLCCGRCLRLCCGRCPHRAALLCGLRPSRRPARSAQSRLQTGSVGEVPATWEDRPEQSEEEASVAAGVPTVPLCSAVSDRLTDRLGRRSPGHLGRPAGTIRGGGVRCGRCPHRAALLCGLRPAHGPARSAKSRLQTGTVGAVQTTWEDRPEHSGGRNREAGGRAIACENVALSTDQTGRKQARRLHRLPDRGHPKVQKARFRAGTRAAAGILAASVRCPASGFVLSGLDAIALAIELLHTQDLPYNRSRARRSPNRSTLLQPSPSRLCG